jgi:signal transduction histidine kinase
MLKSCFPKAAVLFIVLFASICCTQKKELVQNEAGKNSPADSVLLLIERGRDARIPTEDRRVLLQQALNRARITSNDSLKTSYFSRLSLAYLQLPDSTLFRETNKQVMLLAHNDSLTLAEAHWDLAQLFNSYTVLDSAFYHYSAANKIFSQIGDDFLSARMIYNMAVIQGEVKDYTGSEINTIRAIELFKPLDKNEQLYYSYNNLGSITKELEDYERAIDYYEQARIYQERIKEANTYELSIENNLGVVYQEMGQHQTAIPHFEKVTSDYSLVEKSPKLYARALNNLAYSRHKIDEKADPTGAFKKAVRILDSIEDWQGIARAHYNGAEYYKDRKDTVHALAHADLAMEYALKSKNNKRLLETMELMVSLDPENAVAHTQAYIRLDDSLQREERAIRNKFARIRFETDQFIAQNELLAEQRRLWIGIAGGVFLLTFSVLIIVIQRIRNQKLRFLQQQQETNQEIFNLMLAQNQKLEEGKQSEQKRISEELHDGILGEMNGVRMVLLGLNKKMDEAAVALRAQAISKLQEIQEEIRTISHALSAASYRKFHNFVISLQDLLKNIGDAAGIRHEMIYDENIDWDALKGDVKINLYRIVQESLQNCVKHSGADTISLHLHGNSRNIEVTIADNGRGFNSQNGKKGIGHKNISSRVKKLNGNWDISSKPGRGTTVKIRIPYKDSGVGDDRETVNRGKLQEV